MTKDRIIRAIQALPDDVTLSDAIEHLIFFRKIEIGLEQSRTGQTIALEHIESITRSNDLDSRVLAAREATIAALYDGGLLSGRDARTCLRMSRREFEEMLSRYDVSPLLDTDENIRSELDQ